MEREEIKKAISEEVRHRTAQLVHSKRKPSLEELDKKPVAFQGYAWIEGCGRNGN